MGGGYLAAHHLLKCSGHDRLPNLLQSLQHHNYFCEVFWGQSKLPNRVLNLVKFSAIILKGTFALNGTKKMLPLSFEYTVVIVVK